MLLRKKRPNISEDSEITSVDPLTLTLIERKERADSILSLSTSKTLQEKKRCLRRLLISIM